MGMALGAVGLFVDDMGVMVRFYRDVMGVPLEWDGGPFTGVRTEGGIFLNICERKGFEEQVDGDLECPRGIRGNMQLTFNVPRFTDVDREFERVVNAGARPVTGPKTEPYGLRVCFFADPEGNLVGICSADNG